MKLRVWYIRNVPGKPRLLHVESVEEAKVKIRELTEQDLKDDGVVSNAMGLEYYDEEDKDWSEYYDNEGQDIMEMMKGEREMNNNDTPELQLSGLDGNVFSILGRARQVAKKAGWSKEKIEEFSNKAMGAGDYDHVLQICMDYFDVT